MPDHPHLLIRGLTTRGMGTPDLQGIDLTVPPGVVHGVLSERRSGSTLLAKTLGGALGGPWSGRIQVDGKDFAPRSPRDPGAVGLAVVQQQDDLLENLGVFENAVLGREPSFLGLLNPSKARRTVETAFEVLDIPPFLHRTLPSLSPLERFWIRLVRALVLSPKILVLDKPGESLTEKDGETCLRVATALKARGLTVVLISHNPREVFDHTESISILRQGRVVASHLVGQVDEETLFRQMSGRGEGADARVDEILARFGVSERERDIIRLLLMGLSNQDIGGNLDIAPNTVKAHVYSIYRKTGVKNRMELAHLVRHGGDRRLPVSELP